MSYEALVVGYVHQTTLPSVMQIVGQGEGEDFMEEQHLALKDESCLNKVGMVFHTEEQGAQVREVPPWFQPRDTQNLLLTI